VYVCVCVCRSGDDGDSTQLTITDSDHHSVLLPVSLSLCLFVGNRRRLSCQRVIYILATTNISLVVIFVVRLCTKFEVCRPSRSKEMTHF